MSGLVSLLRRSGTGTYVPPTDGSIRHGFNMVKVGPYNATYPFIDLVKGSELFWGGTNAPGATATADGWLTGLPAGNTAVLTVIYSITDVGGYVQPGLYEVVSTSGATLSVQAGPGITQTLTSVNRCTFTLADLTGVSPGWSSFYLRLNVQNATGSPIGVPDLRCNLISEAADLASGKVFRQAYVDAYTGAKTIRAHDLYAFDSASVTWERYFSNYNQTLTKRCYAGDGGYISGFKVGNAPVAVQLEVPRRAGARPWINVPLGMGQRGYSYDHATNSFRVYGVYSDNGSATAIPHGFVDGERLRSYSFDSNVKALYPYGNDVDLFVKNPTIAGGLGFQLSQTRFGAVVDISSGAAVHTTTGNIGFNSLVITNIASLTNVAVGSVVYNANLYGGIGVVSSLDSATQVTLQGLDSSDSTPAIGTTLVFNGDVPGGQAVRYSGISSVDIDPVTDMIQPYFAAIKTYNDAHVDAKAPLFEPSNEIWNFGFPSYRFVQKIASIFAGNEGNTPAGLAWYMLKMWKTAETVFGVGNFTMLHPGQGTFFGNLGDSFDYVDPGIRHAGQTLKQQYINALAADVTVNPTVVYTCATYLGGSGNPSDGALLDGDVFQKAYDEVGSTAIPNSYWDARFNSEIAWLAVNMTADIAGARGKVPNILTALYECGHQVNGGSLIRGDSNLYAIALNYLAYLDGAPGGAMWQRYIDNVLAPHLSELYSANHYSGVGGRTVGYGFFAWPMVPGNLVDTPRSLAWKAF